MENEIRRFNTAHPRWRKEKKRPSMSYCRFFHSDELDAADDGTQGQFDFFQGEAHANAVARTHGSAKSIEKSDTTANIVQ